jgi:hypothetical protein
MGMSWAKPLKRNVEKMSIFRPANMLKKTNELQPSRHDINENKGERRWMRG